MMQGRLAASILVNDGSIANIATDMNVNEVKTERKFQSCL